MGEGIEAADVSSSSSPSSSPAALLPPNLSLLSALLAFAVAQFLKLITTCYYFFVNKCSPMSYTSYILRYKEKKWDSRKMISSGGMPSSHSATVVALATAIGLQEGTAGSAFAIAIVLACVVMYDASGIRLHAGRQAELLNQIICELPAEHHLSGSRPLRDSLGHTPIQVVAGAVLGFVAASLMQSSN